MGIGHQKQIQLPFSLKYSLSHGGSLRNRRQGRGQRPLSSREPLHVVFKIQKTKLRFRSLRSPQSFRLIQKLIHRYSNHFFIRIEQVSIQNDHLHLSIRTTRRSQFLNFFRVLSGQIAQRFEKAGFLFVTDTPKGLKKSLWQVRPFSRVVRGWKAYKIVRDYIQLNEKEAMGEIPYQKRRLKGLSMQDWQSLWT